MGNRHSKRLERHVKPPNTTLVALCCIHTFKSRSGSRLSFSSGEWILALLAQRLKISPASQRQPPRRRPQSMSLSPVLRLRSSCATGSFLAGDDALFGPHKEMSLREGNEKVSEIKREEAFRFVLKRLATSLPQRTLG